MGGEFITRADIQHAIAAGSSDAFMAMVLYAKITRLQQKFRIAATTHHSTARFARMASIWSCMSTGRAQDMAHFRTFADAFPRWLSLHRQVQTVQQLASNDDAAPLLVPHDPAPVGLRSSRGSKRSKKKPGWVKRMWLWLRKTVTRVLIRPVQQLLVTPLPLHAALFCAFTVGWLTGSAQRVVRRQKQVGPRRSDIQRLSCGRRDVPCPRVGRSCGFAVAFDSISARKRLRDEQACATRQHTRRPDCQAPPRHLAASRRPRNTTREPTGSGAPLDA